MEKFTTSDRLKQIIKERRLKQIDILNACKPYCEMYGVKLAKNDLSQYVSGKVQPGQDKLSILGMALNVNEVWLMGYDVPSGKDELKTVSNPLPLTTDLSEESIEVARAYDRASLKDKNVVRQVLDLPPVETSVADTREKAI